MLARNKLWCLSLLKFVTTYLGEAFSLLYLVVEHSTHKPTNKGSNLRSQFCVTFLE
jgi:hypothetical protein